MTNGLSIGLVFGSLKHTSHSLLFLQCAEGETSSERVARLLRVKRVMPPGRWRIARPLAGNEYVFMRFATRGLALTYFV